MILNKTVWSLGGPVRSEYACLVPWGSCDESAYLLGPFTVSTIHKCLCIPYLYIHESTFNICEFLKKYMYL